MHSVNLKSFDQDRTAKSPINLIWYGKFNPSQRAIISDFITSISSPAIKSQPSTAKWWKLTEKYYHLANSQNLALTTGSHLLDGNYSLGKSLTNDQIIKLASKGSQTNAINVVLTSADVAVDGFCSSRCGTHGSSVDHKFAYVWVGNSETQCPGQCAWPFHQPIYGPQSPPLVAPNNDVGLDGMVINVASLLAGTVTNPFGNGFFQGPKEAPLEAGSACTVKGLILDTLETSWWIQQVVPVITLMALMEGSICCLHSLTQQPHSVLL
ncbi:hypothetical protein TSUD_393960 [Trifolium subterraneum]|uniref:Phosphate-induced protein 1 n=1 Tax=Trifolium subterraneum TaxID=3900 RepID=A0A2Z6NCY2_TRISU|nr:hypothetical protein TSUD_393960 [Trifolium subterraneum]